MYSILVAYVVLVAHFAITEGRRRGQGARGGQYDKKSTRFIGLAVIINVIILISANALNYLQIGLMADVIGWIGIAVMLCGTALRLWATRALGKFYTRTLLISDGHRVVREGPYKTLRHPGYLGIILLFIGAGLATVNWIAATLVMFTIVAPYPYRIRCEERMLVASFGQQYKDYADHTWRLLPFIW
jgi:protein-S-isoprenylcysteine O-methyltransferase